MADLPLILAGPILRRVEPRLVAVWVALSDRRSLLLTVFEGRQPAGAGTGVFTGGTPRVRGATNSLRIGDKLHVAVVVAEVPPAPAQALTPGVNYSYNVGLAPFDQGAAQAAKLDPTKLTPTADLRSEQLLRNQPIAGRPHLALGYDEGELPGFALPPPALTDLRILHGSCRRPGVHLPGGRRHEELRRPRMDRRPDPRVAPRHGQDVAVRRQTSGRTSCSSPATRSTPTTSPR